MSHSSDLSYLTRAVFTLWTFIWFLQHVWHVDRFEALAWKRVKKIELKSAITILLIIMCPLQLFYDVFSSIIKYEEGFIVVPTTGEIITTPYQYWSDFYKQWLVPIDYVLCANFSVQTSLLFLLQSFWLYIGNLAKTSFMGSFEFKSYIIYSIFSLSIFPILQYTFRANTLYMEIVPQLAYAVCMGIIALLGVRSHHRFMKLLKVTRSAASAQQSVIRKLEYFRDMNRCLSAALVIGSTALTILCIDALTEAKWLNSHKFTADILITHVNYGLYLVFVLLILIFYPAKNLASDSATIGKSSSLYSKKSFTTTLPQNQSLAPSGKCTRNYRQQFGVDPNDDYVSSRSSQPSSYYIDMPEDNILSYKAASALSRNQRPESLDMNSAYIQMSPPLTSSSTLSPLSPLSPASTLALSASPPFSPKSSGSTSQSFASLPTSPPLQPLNFKNLNSINYQLPAPIQPAHHNQSMYTKSPETQVIRPTPAFLNSSASSSSNGTSDTLFSKQSSSVSFNTASSLSNGTSDTLYNKQQPFSSVSFNTTSKRSTSDSIGSDVDGYYYNIKQDSISSFETDSPLLHHGRGNSVGSVVDNSSSKRQSKQTKNIHTSSPSVSSKLSRPPSTTITPVIRIISTSSGEQHDDVKRKIGGDHKKSPSSETQISRVGSGAGIPQQHRKQSLSSSPKTAVSRGAPIHTQSSATNAQENIAQRKRSSSSASLTKTNSTSILKSALKNTAKRSSGSSTSSVEFSSETAKMKSKRASPPSSVLSNAISSVTRASSKRVSPPPASLSNNLNNETTMSSRSASIKRASPPPPASSPTSPSIIKSIDTSPATINPSSPSRSASRKASPTSPPTRQPPSPPTRPNPPSPPARPNPPPPPPRNPNTRTSPPTSPSTRVTRPPLIRQQQSSSIRSPPPSVSANVAFPDNIEEKYIIRGTGPSELLHPPNNVNQKQTISSEQLLQQYQNILMGTSGTFRSTSSSASSSPRSAEIGLAW
ncbi:5596_t:CDS:2 [Ambispora gerdemannii]|uniref:5596_t:CDS:1 n=1 Tax=Ambispora gerdemannii TaxID=144530 RepID=A0A9N8VB83_9GLOM|nr:5596_t:CDS:2 [Ambispora gerdemannii]